jgi:hypothetical protein
VKSAKRSRGISDAISGEARRTIASDWDHGLTFPVLGLMSGRQPNNLATTLGAVDKPSRPVTDLVTHH